MNLTNDKVSEFIAVLMGKCWKHDYRRQYDRMTGEISCTKCGQIYSSVYTIPAFDAFTPDGIWQWKEFMEKELPEVWEKYLGNCLLSTRMSARYGTAKFIVEGNCIKGLNQQLNARTFAEWMTDKENMKLWAYVECPHIKALAKWSITYNCPECKNTKHIINPKYAAAVEWLEKEEK